ncbi:MAG: SGNH/GDSL hydrolase family protein [Pseudomonadota bacterium]
MTTRPAPGTAKPFVTPEILVLGDSQLSFGSGELMLDFFQNFDRHCRRFVDDATLRTRISNMRTQMIGARSTSLQSWVSKRGKAWSSLCKKDKSWGVNASVWGHNATPGRLYHQMGEGKKFDVCRKGLSPLQALLRRKYYAPDLLMFYLIGNGSGRLANNAKAAESDVAALMAQLPPSQKCLFMTTTPIHTPRRNRTRIKAERALKKAFERAGNRCSFVPALTPVSIASIQGKRQYFRRHKSGKVKDPFHPNEKATRKFLNVIKPKLCRAIAGELSMPQLAASEAPEKSHVVAE